MQGFRRQEGYAERLELRHQAMVQGLIRRLGVAHLHSNLNESNWCLEVTAASIVQPTADVAKHLD